jgi:branched-chain amino acid aminotransferase group I
MTETIYLNGSLVSVSEARVSVFDHGFLYGYGLFETMRAYNGRIFLLDRHLKRLHTSAGAIGLSGLLSGLDLEKACIDTLQANGMKDARLRLTVTGGESDAFPWEGKVGQPTIVITVRSYTGLPPEEYEKGYRIGLSSVRRCKESRISHLKSTSYLASVVGKIEAARQDLDEALLLNNDGYLAEGGSSNVFFVRSSRLVTPSVASGILPGITRELVIELAEELHIPVTEGTVGIAVIRQCEEAFLTNSVMEIMPVTSAGDKSGRAVIVGSGKPGPITRKLMVAYKERVKKATTE